MPVLSNPRHEAFAQAIVKGLASERPNGKNTAKAAYLAVGYSPANDQTAGAAASRLLRKVKPVVDRIRETARAGTRAHRPQIGHLTRAHRATLRPRISDG